MPNPARALGDRPMLVGRADQLPKSCGNVASRQPLRPVEKCALARPMPGSSYRLLRVRG